VLYSKGGGIFKVTQETFEKSNNELWWKTAAALQFASDPLGNLRADENFKFDVLKKQKLLLLELIQKSKVNGSPEITPIIQFIKDVEEDQLSASAYGKMIEAINWEKFKMYGRLKTDGLILTLEVLSRLLKTEIEYEIIAMISNEIIDLDLTEYDLVESKLSDGLKGIELSEIDILLLLKKSVEYVLTEGSKEISKYIKPESHSYAETTYAMCFFTSLNYNFYNDEWAPITSSHTEDIEGTNKFISENLNTYLDYFFKISESEKYFDSYKLVKLFSLWQLEKKGILKISLKKNMYNRDASISDRISRLFPNLDEVRIIDYKNNMYPFFQRREIEMTSDIKLDQCAESFFESKPAMIRPDLKDRKTIKPFHLFGFSLNRNKIDITIKSENNQFNTTVSDDVKINDLNNDTISLVSKNEDELSIKEIDELKKRREYWQNLRSVGDYQMVLLSITLNILFKSDDELVDFMTYYKNDYTRYINKIVLPSNLKEERANLDSRYSPKIDSLLLHLSFNSTVFPLTNDIFNTVEMPFSNFLKTEIVKTENEYDSLIKQLSSEYFTRAKPFIDEYNSWQTKKDNRYNNLKEYFTSLFESKSKNSSRSNDFSGLTLYFTNSNRFFGKSFFVWDNQNVAKIESSVSFTPGSITTVNLIGKIMENTSSDDKDDWPYIFVSSKGDKYLISLEDQKCYSTIKFTGAGNNKGIYLTFDIVL
jgi:hypothetical protein